MQRFKRMAFPIETDQDLDQILRDEFISEFRKGYTTVQGVCLPDRYEEFAEAIDNFEVRDDDIWICSFPKTGRYFIRKSYFAEKRCVIFRVLI